ncbi:MAG: hypothetical protein ACREFJ_00145 [Acetobacteraceae bacterium]
MLRSALVVTAICLTVAMTARANEARNAAHPPTANYEAVLQPNGTIKLVPKGGPGAKPPSPPESAQTAGGALQRSISAALKNQQWYLLKNPDGSVNAIYSVPSGNALSSSVFSSIEPGQSIERVSPTAFGYFKEPSARQIRTILEQMMTNAKKAVCGMNDRPSTFGTSVDITVGALVVSGTIRFDVSWETDKLCAA